MKILWTKKFIERFETKLNSTYLKKYLALGLYAGIVSNNTNFQSKNFWDDSVTDFSKLRKTY